MQSATVKYVKDTAPSIDYTTLYTTIDYLIRLCLALVLAGWNLGMIADLNKTCKENIEYGRDITWHRNKYYDPDANIDDSLNECTRSALSRFDWGPTLRTWLVLWCVFCGWQIVGVAFVMAKKFSRHCVSVWELHFWALIQIVIVATYCIFYWWFLMGLNYDPKRPWNERRTFNTLEGLELCGMYVAALCVLALNVVMGKLSPRWITAVTCAFPAICGLGWVIWRLEDCKVDQDAVKDHGCYLHSDWGNGDLGPPMWTYALVYVLLIVSQALLFGKGKVADYAYCLMNLAGVAALIALQLWFRADLENEGYMFALRSILFYEKITLFLATYGYAGFSAVTSNRDAPGFNLRPMDHKALEERETKAENLKIDLV